MDFWLLFLALWGSAGPAEAIPAKWRTEYVAFSVPWVDSLARDSRVVLAAAQDYPSYVSVRFLATARDRDQEPEFLWVRILDLDSVTGIYLGDVVDAPRKLKSVHKHDNILFKFGTIMDRRPTAILVGDSYLAQYLRTPFGQAFVAGVAAHREVDYGRDRAALPACFTQLRSAVALVDSNTPRAEAFHASLLLGQCYSVGDQVDSAIAWYVAAMKIDPADLDASLSLLSEYSVKYALALRNRNVRVAQTTKASMQKLSDWIRVRDTPDHRAGKWIDMVYSCSNPARAQRKDPCTLLHYQR